MSEPTSAGAAKLAEIIRRRGSNPHALASDTGGRVSDATVRNYVKGGPVRRDKLRIIAETLGPPDGVELLEAYGEHEMAAHLAAGGPASRLEEDLADRLARLAVDLRDVAKRIEEDLGR